MLDVEAALAWAQGQVGAIRASDAKVIAAKASTRFVKLQRVKQLEEETKHETMAVVNALAEAAGKSGAQVHLGATSNDILDTALALQINDALALIEKQLFELETLLMKLARKYARTVMVGRTHGQQALPITLGLKFAVWLREVARHLERLAECRPRVVVGKMTGAVGTMAGLGHKADRVQSLVMKRLSLGEPEVTTQILQRDRYAELMGLLANIASSLDKFATEIRNLQRTEIAEVSEPFVRETQVGSSTLPQKANPRICENISSLARLVRGLVGPSLELVVSWHERDLTNSATERFTIPEAFILVNHMLASMTYVLSGLKVDTKRIAQNVKQAGGVILAEAVMLSLVNKGMPRQQAHGLVRRIALEALDKGKDFHEALLRDSSVRRLLSPNEINKALDSKNYLGKTELLITKALKKTEHERASARKF